jgi:hypothetical protein
MAVNLLRNSKVYFTTSLNSDDTVNFAGCDATNTHELQVLEGFSFSQNTTTDTITITEAGPTPLRGQRAFNTALQPVDFSMTTYIRPRFFEGGSSDKITAEEAVLWNALMGANAIGSGGAWVETADAVTPTTVCAYTNANSNVHQLQKFALIINFDAIQYTILNAALDSATIDFGLDAISSVQWAGKATRITQSETITSFKYQAKNSTAKYIANKLSVLTLFEGIAQSSGTSFNIPITGGNITISNNLTYLTPANLGVVNLPVTYFTGTRSISGSLTAYLRTGASENFSGELLAGLLANAATASETKYTMTVKLGGANVNRVELYLPATMLAIPTVATDQVITTTINFTAQGSSGGNYSVEDANELQVKYFAAA